MINDPNITARPRAAGFRLVKFPASSFKVLGCLVSFYVSAAELSAAVPVITAGSRVVDVIDGDNAKVGYWYIMPEKKVDVYYVEFPRKPHRVVFRTDQDSLSFDTAYGGVYDFIIRLKGQDCHTRIVAKEKFLRSYVRNAPAQLEQGRPDAIPFTVGSNGKIYIKGRINESGLLNFQFDLGCMGSVIKKGSVAKTKITFDGRTVLINSQGTNSVRNSSRNTLEIGDLKWSANIDLAEADNMTDAEDGLLGNSLFQDKVIEIDYDRLTIFVHESLPQIDPGWSKHPIRPDGEVPFIQASLTTKDGTFTNWYQFDTGYSGSVRAPGALKSRTQKEAMSATAVGFNNRPMVLFPELRVGNESFSNVITVLPNSDSDIGILGNAILKRFNIILDNQNGFIYLRANSLLQSHYDRSQLLATPARRWIKPMLAVLFATAALVGVRMGLSARRRRR